MLKNFIELVSHTMRHLHFVYDPVGTQFQLTALSSPKQRETSPESFKIVWSTNVDFRCPLSRSAQRRQHQSSANTRFNSPSSISILGVLRFDLAQVTVHSDLPERTVLPVSKQYPTTSSSTKVDHSPQAGISPSIGRFYPQLEQK
jgi:hypothetical protein